MQTKAKVKAKPKKKSPGRDRKGRFLKGNEVAVKWTVDTIVPELNKILAVLAQDDEGDGSNIVRANDIKYAEEAVMCAGVELTAWDYWNSNKMEFSENSPVFLLIKKIKKICELRLGYAGQVMDIFHLKNHYGYQDKKQTEITGKDSGPIQMEQSADLSNLSDDELNQLITLQRKAGGK